jgi:hypothetical protein
MDKTNNDFIWKFGSNLHFNKYNIMKHTKGKLIMGDFEEKTMTFEIDGEFTLQAGNYFLIREEDYKAPEMYEALKNTMAVLNQTFTSLTEEQAELRTDLKSLLKEIES